MSVLFLWLLAAYGLAFFLQNKLPRPERFPSLLKRLFGCIYCLGFHSGWMLWLVRSWGKPLSSDLVVECLGWSFASASFAYFIDTAARWLEERPDLGE